MADSSKNRTYKCPNCGADLRYDPQTGMVVCDYCAASLNPDDYNSETGTWRGQTEHWRSVTDDGSVNPSQEEQTRSDAADDGYIDMNEFICTQCGAKIYSTDVTVATFCSYCGSSVVLERRVSREKKPDRIIPFTVTHDDCVKNYRKFCRKSLFAPSYIRKDSEVERFRGIYMPYWTYDTEIRERVNVSGKLSHRRGDYIITDHYKLKSDVDAAYEGFAFDASGSFADDLSGAIAPFRYQEAMDYNLAYFSGFYADAGDVDGFVYVDEVNRAVTSDTASGVFQQKPVFVRYGVPLTAMKNALHVRSSYRRAMYPVWFLSIRNKKGDRVSYAAVNGQTGKVAADVPVDFGKYLLGSFLLAIPIFLVLMFFLTLTPKNVTVGAGILSLIAMLLANKLANDVFCMEHRSGDRGALFTMKLQEEDTGEGTKKKKKKAKKSKGSETKAPMSKKWGIFLRGIAGMVIPAQVLLAAPVSDVWYYVISAAALLLNLWSFFCIIREYNRLTERPLPQFEVRGGDQDAPV